MIQLSLFTEKSKRVLLKSIKMAQECGYKYVEPQILMAAIVNEGRDMLSYILQFLNIDKIDFCHKINETFSQITEMSQDAPILNSGSTQILQFAKEVSVENGCELVPIEFIFFSTILVPSPIKNIFASYNIGEEKLGDAISHYRRNIEINNNSIIDEYQADYQYLNKYAKNLCKCAQDGTIPNAIGRDDEIRRLIHIISRQTKNNPILVGEPGTGKTAIVEGLAHRIVTGDIPRELSNLKLYSLDAASMIAGASHVGEFEERLKGIIDEVSNSEENIIVFIDEIHLLIGEGRNGGAMDAANIMKPELARGKFKVIGATTLDEYKKYIEQDKAFERRFQKILVNEPTEDAALAILRGVRVRLEEFHNIRIKDEAIRAAVKLSTRYITDRYLPDKAIDLLDEASAKMKIARSSSPTELDSLRRRITTKEIECESLRRDNPNNMEISVIQEEISNLREEENSLHAKWQSERHLLDEIQIRRNEIARLEEEKKSAESQGIIDSVVNISIEINRLNEEVSHLLSSLEEDSDILLKPELDEQDIMSTITEWTGIPISKLSEDETGKLTHIEEFLSQMVIGQEEAKRAVSNAIRRNRIGFGDMNKPIGSFLFLGTTGVGKTELCKALGEYLFNSKESLIRIDMSEYQQAHEVSKLFGAPPGYIGYDEGGQLTEAVRRKPYSVILFDEREKANPKVFETLLQVLDDGRMTDGKGRTIDFKNTIIVMTSNLGQNIIYSTLQGRQIIDVPRIGFTISENIDEQDGEEILVTNEKICKAKEKILTELKSKVAPEFINRIDDIVMFLPLTKENVNDIVVLQINTLINKMKGLGYNIVVTNEAVEFLSKVGYQPEYGARPIKRAINSFLIDELSLSVLNGEISKDKQITISSNEYSLTFTNNR